MWVQAEIWCGTGRDMVGGWRHSRIESLQVLSTFDFGLWTLDLDLDCDKRYLPCHREDAVVDGDICVTR